MSPPTCTLRLGRRLVIPPRVPPISYTPSKWSDAMSESGQERSILDELEAAAREYGEALNVSDSFFCPPGPCRECPNFDGEFRCGMAARVGKAEQRLADVCRRMTR